MRISSESPKSKPSAIPAALRAIATAPTGSGSAPPTVPFDVTKVKADVALVVVHGMGHSKQGETLLEWSEQILGRIDWMTKYAGVPRGPRPTDTAVPDGSGVTIIDSVLSGSGTPHIIADARWLVDGELKRRRIAILEARWSESFMPMTRAQVFQWGVRFLWRTVLRMIWQFIRTLVLTPWFAGFTRAPLDGQRLSTDDRGTPQSLWARLAAVVLAAVGAVIALVISLFIVLLAIVMSVVLPLISPLMLIPAVHRALQGSVDALVDFVGDVGTYKERPLRAAAMRIVLRDRLVEAKGMLRKGGTITVLAHSQGAAISAKTIFAETDLEVIPVVHLHTVGAAIVLLGNERWKLSPRSDDYKPVRNWGLAVPDVRWTNYWAIWDPFAAGSIADSFKDRTTRWRGAYVRGAADHVPGPEERAVHNTSMPLTDHQSYSSNVLQVIDPVARQLLGASAPPLDTDQRRRDSTRVVVIRRMRGVNLIAAIVIAALAVTFPAFTDLVARVVQWVTALVASIVTALSPASDSTADSDPGSSFLAAGGSLTVIGMIVTAVALAALLIWVNSVFSVWAERNVVWEWDHPLPPSGWAFLVT
ncbi:MAG: hypothetical protein ABWX82_15015, partial [Leifsonia sp.]